MFNIKRLEDLKSRLSREKRLNKVWSFYMDHFADHEEFIAVGHRTSHSLIEKVVPMITKQISGKTSKDLFLILIPEYQFIHGGFTVEKRIGGVIYFEQTLTGMVALSDILPSSQVHYSRFTGQNMGS